LAVSWRAQGPQYFLSYYKEMFGRVTQHTLAQSFGRLKSHVAGVYSQVKHFASMLDNAVQVGRRAYGVLRPMLEDTATGKRVAGGVNNALMSYDQLRGDVLSVHDKTHSVIGNLRKAVPEINL
jgi:hypothetical protein